MKKKLWLMLLALASALCICFGIAACSRRGGGTRAPSEGLEFELNADETSYTVTGIGTCTDRNIVIPSEYQGHPVTAIEARAFYNCSSLQSITIPESVTSIGNNAFYGTAFYNDDANWISDVLYIGDYLIEAKSTISGTCNIREGTKLIADSAFYYRPSLEGIAIPESVTSIGDWAFRDCSSLQSVTFERDSQLTSIEEYAFYNCLSLNAVYITDLEAWCGIDYYDSDFANPLYYARHLYVDGEEVTDLHIPDGVTEIKPYAFEGGAFRSVTIPAGVTSIGDSAFALCDSLQSVMFAGDSKLTSIGDSAFALCDSLTSITIPAGVTSIGDWAFQDCRSLQSVTFERDSQLTSIGAGAFNDCDSLTSITIPAGVTSIGGSAFGACDSLQSVTFEGESKLTSIGRSAFAGCSLLTSITIPESVTSIGDWAFRDCSSLQSVTFEEDSQLTSIGSAAFYGCRSLTSITIPAGVTLIEMWAFEYCSSLQSVTFEEDSQLTSIEYDAFKGCSSLNAVYITDLEAWCGIDFGDDANPLSYAHHLYVDGQEVTDLHIPESVTSIEDLAFYNCSSLQSVTFEGDSKLTSIKSYAFSGCSSLTSITIPESVTSIGDHAFYECYSLEAVYITDLEAWCGIGFGGYYGYYANPLYYAHHLYVDGEEVTDLHIPDSVTEIKPYAFYNCSSLQSVIFERTDGWKVSRNSDMRYAQDVTVSDPQTAARYLTNTYENYYWKRY